MPIRARSVRRPIVRAVGLALVAAAAVVAWRVAPEVRAQGVEPATLVLRNGTIVTVDAALPEAQALAARGDRLVAVGSNAEIQRFVGPATTVIDLAGATAIPGIVESHGHFMGMGEMQLGLDLMNVASWDEVIALVKAAVAKAKPGEWILGRGWHQEKWTTAPSPSVEGFPVHEALSRVSPDNPVMLDHASGHALFANAKAMALAGVTASTASPAGGEILKDASGAPIGIFRETASGLVEKAYRQARAAMTPQQLEEESRHVLQLAVSEALANGITTFHDAGVSFQTADFYKREADAGRLRMRLYVMVAGNNDTLARHLALARTIGYANHHVTVRTIKIQIDGALGSRGAWLLQPYQDLPSSTGLNTTPAAEIVETTKLAMRHGYQVAIHAIGDRANRETLDLYEAAFKAFPDKTDVRWRVEHAQHLHPADIPRFGRLGVIPAMQGVHCTSDAPYVLARLGAQRAEEGAYVWQKLIASGATISNGTDVPVEDVDPLASFYATVTRRLKDGSVFFGDQKMTRLQALKSYTINGAYAGFEEAIKGTLTVGKLADITVLSQNLLTVPDEQIRSTRVLYTIVGGKVEYRAK